MFFGFFRGSQKIHELKPLKLWVWSSPSAAVVHCIVSQYKYYKFLVGAELAIVSVQERKQLQPTAIRD